MPKSLHDEMERLARIAVTETLEDEAAFAQLMMIGADDKMTLVALAVNGGAQIAQISRTMIWEHQPAMAILQMETWSVITGTNKTETDPDRLDVLNGRKRPMEIPEHKRDESLVMYGETASGENAYRFWQIIKRGKTRDLAEVTEKADGYESRFHPLFIVEDTERLLDGGLIEKGREPVPAEVLEAARHIPHNRRHELVRLMVGEMLANGYGSTSRTWEDLQGRREQGEL